MSESRGKQKNRGRPPVPRDEARTEIDASLPARAARTEIDPGPHADLARTEIDPGLPAQMEAPTGSASPSLNPPTRPAPTPAGSREFSAGDRIRQYEVIREIGRGGMGRVLLARDTVLGRLVALKLLNANARTITERFLIEARTTAQVNHENIVVIHEVGEHDGLPFMVLEYLEGEPLATQIRDRALPATRTVELIVPVVRALVRAHQFDIIHRDLKPENIFVTDAGTVKVLDFGIAKLFSDERRAGDSDRPPTARPDGIDPKNLRLTREGALIGTLPYMSPEQFGLDAVDHRTDIWAVGIILYEMLAGHHPLAPLKPERLMYHAAKLDVPMPGMLDAVDDIPEQLAAVVDRCLSKSKHQRFASAQELLEALEALLPGRLGPQLREGENPYPGLVAFQEADANRFFGRSRDIVQLIRKIEERPLVGLLGPSGVGKSSLVRAGLVPALRASDDLWECLTIRPGRDPLESLVGLFESMTISTGNSIDRLIAEHDALGERIRSEPGYLANFLRARARERGSRILLFVDQFEELYTLVGDPSIRGAFTSVLSAIADEPSSPLRVVISMRSDFLDRVGENMRFLDELSRGLVFLRPLDGQGLKEALIRPAELVGYRFETPTLVDRMLDVLDNTPGALPLLQFSAAKLWETRDRPRKLLTESAYQRMGGVAGTLAAHANEVVAGLTTQQQLLLREIFLRLVTSEGTRAIVDISELSELGGDPGEVDRLLQQLVQSRLLVVQTRGGADGAAVEIVHESLLTQWPTLRLWLEEGREDRAFLEQLRTTARQWDRSGRPTGLLWRGEALDEARRFSQRYQGDLAVGERDFLDAVLALGARAGRRRRLFVAAIIILLSLLVVAGAIGLFLIRSAERDAVRNADIAEQAREEEKSARQDLQKQLDVIRQKEAEKQAAEAREREARQDVVRAEERAEQQRAMSRAELQAAYERVKRASDKATEEAERAQRAAAEERKAKRELQRLLNDKKREIERLKKERSKIKTTLE